MSVGSLLPSPVMLASRVLNAMLERELWAHQLVQAQSGKVILLNVADFTVRLAINANGFFEAAAADSVPDVTLTLSADQLRKLVAMSDRSPEKIASVLHLQGDAGLAQMVSILAKDLRWDIRHDLSQKFGPIVGNFMLDTLMKGKSLIADKGTRAAENVSEYLAYEVNMLANRTQVKQLEKEIQALEQDLARLEGKV